MFGKIAAAMLIAAAQATHVEGWDFAPAPEVEMPGDAPMVDIPDGDWALQMAMFALVDIPEDDPVWDWADGLSAENAWATPDGQVNIGLLDLDDADVWGWGIGFGWGDGGNMFISTGEPDNDYADWTQNFDPNIDFTSDWDPSWISIDNAYEWPDGNGESWAYSYASDEMWLYNDSSEGVDDWEEGPYTVTWIESNADGTQWAGFTVDYDLVAYGGAKQLIAATTTAILLI